MAQNSFRNDASPAAQGFISTRVPYTRATSNGTVSSASPTARIAALSSPAGTLPSRTSRGGAAVRSTMLAERRRSGGTWSVLAEELGRADHRHAFRARPPLGGGQLLRHARVVCVADEREDAVEGGRDDLSPERSSSTAPRRALTSLNCTMLRRACDEFPAVRRSTRATASGLCRIRGRTYVVEGNDRMSLRDDKEDS